MSRAFLINHKDKNMHNKKSIGTLIVLVSVAGLVWGQEYDEDIVQAEQGAIVVASSSFSDGSGTTLMTVDASEMSGPMVFASDFVGQPMPFANTGDAFSMLNNPSVQKDLQLVDEQLEQIQDISEDFSKRIREKLDEMKDGDGNMKIQGAGFAELIADLKSQQREQIENILLPNQQDRLKQVSRQMKMKRMGSQRAVTELLAKELGISDEQKERIEEKSKKLQAELEAKIAELRAKAKKDLFQELSQDQRKKLENLLGDEFIVKEEDSNNRFRIPRIENFRKKKVGDF